MPKAKSQWQFGELFTPAEARRVLSVTDLTSHVRRLLEREIGSVWVTGEVSNLRAQSSGHSYFSLKDATAQLQCVCFRDEARQTRGLLQDGQKVVLRGDLTVYEPRGQYQLVVRAVELHGVGALQIAFEKLKQKLTAEGLFAQERKRPLPRFPQWIGVVTSPTGAALRDVLHVIERRQPGLAIVLAPCRVQGEGAAAEIAAAIQLLNAWAFAASDPAAEIDALPAAVPAEPARARLDLILVTRGGGSLEDLWAFNEEVVARAIHQSRLPVISAVGHEIDFTISDFVADLRAATPSAAAELITEGPFAARQWLGEAEDRLSRILRQRLRVETERLQGLHGRLTRAHPRRWLNEQWQHLDDLQGALTRTLRQGCRQHQTVCQNLVQRFVRLRPAQVVVERRRLLQELLRRAHTASHHAFAAHQQRWAGAETRLKLLAPDQVLQRGYSITRDAATGQILRTASETRPAQLLKIRLKEGEILSRVTDG